MTNNGLVGIIGAGPTGLSAAILLSRLGIPCCVFEQARGPSEHPKARGIRVRTMELFRQWGLEEELRARALPAEALRFIYCETLAGAEVARTGQLEPGAFAESPTTSCRVAQDAVQHALQRRARAEPGVALLMGTSVTDVAQCGDAVTVTTADGRRFEYPYLIAADGAGSAIRRGLGIEQTGQDVVSWWQSVYWLADLTSWTSDRPCIQFITGAATGRHVQIAPVDGRQRWVTTIALPPSTERPADLTEAQARAIITRAVGRDGLDLSVLGIATFRVSALNAARYREGRVFLAGDAAHVLPPTGGMGMNSGIQDVHNLAWKLAYVLRGSAAERLLDSYESERWPVAEANLAWSLRNGERFRELRTALATGDSRRIAVMLDEQKEHVSALGQDLGFSYALGCLVDDGTPPPAITPGRYLPTARPGHRAPAIWLRTPAGQISTIDLFDRCFSLVLGAEADSWTPSSTSKALQVLRIGEDPLDAPEADLHQVYGITRSGGVLVRPDGHVAWRARQRVPDPAGTLDAVLSRLAIRPASRAGAAA